MSRHVNYPQLVLVLVCSLLVGGLAMHLHVARGTGLAGLVLAPDMTIVDGAGLPPALGPGDHVDRVLGQPVRSLTELSAVARRARGSHIPVKIVSDDEERTWVVTADSLVSAPPDALLDAPHVLTLGGTRIDGPVSFDDLLAAAQAVAPEPLVVRVAMPPVSLEGPVQAVANAPDIRGLAFVLLGALLSLVTLWQRSQLPIDVARDELRAVGIIAGAVASGALATVIVDLAIDPRMWMWVGVPLLTQRGAALAHRLAEFRGGVTRFHYAVVVGPVLVVGVGGLVSLLHGGFLADVEGTVTRGRSLVLLAVTVAGAMWITQSWLVHVGRDSARTPEKLLLPLPLLGGLAAWACSMWFGTAAPAWIVAAFVFTTLDWGVTLGLATFGDIERVGHRYRPEDRTLLTWLGDAIPLAGGARVVLACGLGERWVAVEHVDVRGDGDRALRPSGFAPEVESVLGMLATEGGMLPRHVGDDDAFEGVGERLGVVACIPCPTAEGATPTFFLLACEEGESASEAPDLEALVELASEFGAMHFAAEAQGIAAAFLLRILRRQADEEATPDAMPVALSQERPSLAGPRVDDAVERTRRDDESARTSDELQRWSDALERETSRQWPVDDPDVLSDAERAWIEGLGSGREPVLIIGEPGAGREFMARALHAGSDRASRRFASLDLSTIPTSVVELEIFGDDESAGLAHALRGGTLLLKACSRIAPSALRRVARELDRLDVRLVLAERYVGPPVELPPGLSPELLDLVGERFVHLTPLRERPEYALRVAEFYLQRHAMRYDRVSATFDDALRRKVLADAMPANFHTLQEIVRAHVLGGDVALTTPTSADTPRPTAPRGTTPGAGHEPTSGDVSRYGVRATASRSPIVEPRSALSDADVEDACDDEGTEAEREAIVAALVAAEWNQAEASRTLGISRGKLLRRVRKYGIERPGVGPTA